MEYPFTHILLSLSWKRGLRKLYPRWCSCFVKKASPMNTGYHRTKVFGVDWRICSPSTETACLQYESVRLGLSFSLHGRLFGSVLRVLCHRCKDLQPDDARVHVREGGRFRTWRIGDMILLTRVHQVSRPNLFEPTWCWWCVAFEVVKRAAAS